MWWRGKPNYKTFQTKPISCYLMALKSKINLLKPSSSQTYHAKIWLQQHYFQSFLANSNLQWSCANPFFRHWVKDWVQLRYTSDGHIFDQNSDFLKIFADVKLQNSNFTPYLRLLSRTTMRDTVAECYYTTAQVHRLKLTWLDNVWLQRLKRYVSGQSQNFWSAIILNFIMKD